MSWTVFGGARPAVHLIVVESLHNFKTKWFFNAAKWAGPWQRMLGSAAQPLPWMVLNGCITSRRKGSSTPWKKTGPCFGRARTTHKFKCFWKALYHPDEKILQHREMTSTVFGGARSSVRLNVVESLHNIKTKWFFNAAKWAGPWRGTLGSAAQP